MAVFVSYREFDTGQEDNCIESLRTLIQLEISSLRREGEEEHSAGLSPAQIKDRTEE